LAKLYSYIDSMKRKGGDFLANPLDSMAQGIRNYGEATLLERQEMKEKWTNEQLLKMLEG